MKKTLVAIAALSIVGSAVAQVVISGQFAAGVHKNVGSDTTIGQNGGDNNINFAATEDLGGGLSIAGKGGFYIDGRYQGTRSRDLSLAVSHKSGAGVTYKSADSAYSSRLSLGGTIGTDKNLDDMYGDSGSLTSVTFTSPKFNGFQVAYGINGGLKASTAPTSNVAAGNGLSESGNISLSYSAGKFSGSVDSSGSIGRFRTNAAYDLGMAQVEFHSTNDYDRTSAKADLSEVGVTIPLGAITVGAGYSTNGDVSGTALGATYALSKSTSVNASTVNYGLKADGTQGNSAARAGTYSRVKIVKTF